MKCVRIASDDLRSADALEADGWRFVETLETWRRRMPWKTLRPQRVRIARKADRDACMAIASKAFVFDRLHADPAIPREVADEAKKEWVKAAFEDPDRIFVHGPGTAPATVILGFLITRPRDHTLVIDLIAVEPQVQWGGVGTELVKACLGVPDYRHIEAGTQSANEPARKLYHTLNFRVVKTQKSFHK